MKRVKYAMMMLCVCLFILTMVYDTFILQFLMSVRTLAWNEFFLWITTFGIPFMGIYIFSQVLWQKKWGVLATSGVVALAMYEITSLLKNFFALPRPYQVGTVVPVYETYGFTFPSAHSAFAFMALVLITLVNKNKWVWWFWATWAGIVAFSRVYLGVHHMSDVVFGAALGYSLTEYILLLIKKHNIGQKVVTLIGKDLEFRRQLLHLFFTLALAVGVYLGWLTWWLMLVVTIAGWVLSVYTRQHKVLFFSWALDRFERKKDRHTCPGRGVIILCATTVVILFFSTPFVGFLTLLVTAVGDAVSPLVGQHLGKIPLWWNRKKHVSGLVVSTLVTAVTVAHFVPFMSGLMVSGLAMTAESLSLKIVGRSVDDNLVVPLVAALGWWFVL